MEKIMFSVVVATYNGADYVRAQIESILLAVKEDMQVEIIVTDNGSNDDTIGIVNHIKATSTCVPIRFVYTDRLGVSANFANGISECTGSYIVLADQDDIWEPRKLEVVYEYVKRFPSSDLFAHSAKTFGPETSDRVLHPTVSFGELFGLGCCLVVKKSLADAFVVLEKENFDNSFLAQIGHDRWLCTMASINSSYKLIPDVLLNYRRHGRNFSRLGKYKKRSIFAKFSSLFLDERAYYRTKERYEMLAFLKLRHGENWKSRSMKVKLAVFWMFLFLFKIGRSFKMSSSPKIGQ